jgi:hypothetical protein
MSLLLTPLKMQVLHSCFPFSLKLFFCSELTMGSKKSQKKGNKKTTQVDPFDVLPWPDINSKKTTTVAREIIKKLVG